MENKNQVTCPNCKTQFSIESVLTVEIEKDLNEKLKKQFNDKYLIEKKKIEETFLKNEAERAEELKKLKQTQEQEFEIKRKELEEQTKQKLIKENEQMLEALKKENEEQNEKLRELKKKEIEVLEIQKRMRDLEQDFDIKTKKLLLDKEAEMAEKLGKKAEESFEMKLRDKQKQIDDANKLIDELKRKSEQGSMQLQGETQELAIEEMLKSTFPFDLIQEVGKGMKGADLIQTVRNTRGEICGTIVWESKRTKEFQPLWIEKFKADMRQSGGDVGVIVSQSLPKDMDNFGLKEGLYICKFNEARSVAVLLRETLIRINEVSAAQENKGDKMTMLYHFLTGSEFKNHIEAITEGFTNMRNAIISERNAMERIWKEREKQIDKVLLNTSGLYGSIKGIAGSSIPEVKGLDLGTQID